MKAISIALLVGLIGYVSVQAVSAAEEAKPKHKVLHSFGSGTDGQFPYGGLIESNGTLYGMTQAGGAGANCQTSGGCGTVFAVDRKTGAETVAYSFCSQSNCTDGNFPYAGLVDVNGTLYGTTGSGGANNGGTVFALDPKTGTETVLYSFCSQQNCADGEGPNTDLIDVNGTLYGMTFAGGSGSVSCAGYACGVIYSLDPKSGAEKVLYSFCSKKNCTDGAIPYASLIDVKGTLYGTTSEGGSQTSCGYTIGCGAAVALDLNNGAEKVLYSFCSQQNCADGYLPTARLIDVKGTLYGTTYYGGGTKSSGVVFALDPNTGAQTIVYTFCSLQSCTDGGGPFAGLIDANGTLYGTTNLGGANCETGGGIGCGTVFALDAKTGAEKVLYSFCRQQDCTDGQGSFAGLIDVRGILYGATYTGGSNTSCYEFHGLFGCGTVFALKP